MNESQMNGAIDQAAGRVRGAAGALADDLKTQAKGKAQAMRGQAESAYGDVVDGLTKAAGERPATVLGAAVGFGVLLGLLLARN